MKQLFDPIRRRYVADGPEERVRQSLLCKMVDELGYPSGWIVVERRVGKSKRRLDWLCAFPGGDFNPLIIGECKAQVLSAAAREQVLGYNAHLKAPFVCIATPETVHTLWREEKVIRVLPFLPPFEELIGRLGKLKCTPH